jgi:Domain of unknown function (DUF4386)
MNNRAFDELQRKASRIAGFAFLFAVALVVVANYGINFRLIVPGNAVDTAQNILAHETLIRINIACNLLYVATVAVQIAALYVILKRVDQNLALVAAFCRLVFALAWGVTALDMLGALRLLGDAVYLPVFKADQLQTLARLRIAASFDAYYVGLPFWGLASTACSYLWFKSRYIPRGLAVFGVMASAWCVICAFAFLVFPHFDTTINAYWFDVPMTVFEVALGFYLLFTRLGRSLTAA